MHSCVSRVNLDFAVIIGTSRAMVKRLRPLPAPTLGLPISVGTKAERPAIALISESSGGQPYISRVVYISHIRYFSQVINNNA